MAAKHIILPEADQEIADAYHWLERREAGLGKKLLKHLDEAVTTICEMPEAYAKAFDAFRHMKVSKFPYVIYYEFTDEMVVIYSVFHGSQDPARLRSSLWLRKPQ